MAHMIISQIDAGMAANYRSRDIEWSMFTIIRCQPDHLLTFWSKHHAFDQEVQRSNGRRANLNSHAHSISYDRHMTAKPAWDQKWTCTVDQLSARTAWSACTCSVLNSRRRRFRAWAGAYVRMISTKNIGRFEQKNMSSSELIWAPRRARRPSFFLFWRRLGICMGIVCPKGQPERPNRLWGPFKKTTCGHAAAG